MTKQQAAFAGMWLAVADHVPKIARGKFNSMRPVIERYFITATKAAFDALEREESGTN